MILGHDISNVNGPLHLHDYPNAQFFIAKVNQDATFIDKLFANNRQQARDLGRGFGGYCYGDNKAQPNARASTRRFVDLLGEQQVGEVAALDAEIDGGHGGFLPGDHSDWVWQWGDEFFKLAGYKPKLYVSLAGINDFGLNVPEIADVFDLWLAYWLDDWQQPNPTPPAAPSPWTSYKFQLWQYNADVIDKNYWLGTLETFKASGKPGTVVPGDGYEARFWTPMQKLLDECAISGKHADIAFHAAASGVITLHKIAHDVEPPG